MATAPPHGDSDKSRPATSLDAEQPDQRWTGRARVGTEPVSPPPRKQAAPPPKVPVPVHGRKRTVRPRWGRIALVSVVVLALLLGVGTLSAYLWVKNVDGDLKRTDPFAAVAGRPQKVVDGSLNILLLGSDSRDPGAPVDKAGNWRTDTIMVLHIPADHNK